MLTIFISCANNIIKIPDYKVMIRHVDSLNDLFEVNYLYNSPACMTDGPSLP